jgi:hypothetical protein
MALRDPAKEHEAARAEAAAARQELQQRVGAAAARVLATDDGKVLFEYLAGRFHLRGRSFLAAANHAGACPYAAAVRDGEKAALMHVYDLARLADETILIP